MTTVPPPRTVEERALVVAPRGRDAALATALLAEAGIAAVAVADLGALPAALAEGAGLVLLTEEAVRHADLDPLAGWLRDQPSWSDLPVVLVVDRGGGPERNPDVARLSDALGNLSFVERPFHPTTLASVARVALRSRRRQYLGRAQMEALREGEQRLGTALTAGSLGTWELDLAARTLTASAACKAQFGRPPDDPFAYRDVLAGVHPDDRGRIRDALAHSLATGADYAVEYRHRWPGGGERWIDVRARVLRDGGGAAARLVGVSSDVTERKAAEAGLRLLNATLEQRVRSRTEELERAHAAVLEQAAERARAEAALRQAHKMEALGQLTGSVAHDFNNLLMAILGNLDALRAQVPRREGVARLLDGAVQGARRGAALTQRLLAFARRQDLRILPVDLAALVDGMAELLRRSLGHRIELRAELPPSLPAALADANQVELALLNLAVNARDAMPDGGTLTVALDQVETPTAGDGLAAGRYVRLVVTDTGSGMDAAVLERAVEPFFSTKEPGKGTGLGLSMIHGLAVQSGGALRLSSRPGRGTRAELWLPATAARPADPPTPTDPPAPAEPARPFTVLVVDDDALVAMGTAAMLADLGHAVVEADSGVRALELLRAGQPVDLLLTDHAMPGMTGAQLAQAARALRPDLPILLATGYADLPGGVGADLPRLGKPYDRRQLAARIEALLGRAAAAPAPAAPRVKAG